MLFVIIGVSFISGVIFKYGIDKHRSGLNGHGYFWIEPLSDEGDYKVGFRIPPNQELLEVDQIVLKRDDSRKNQLL